MQQFTEKELIKACLNGNEVARKVLYDQYKLTMMGLCLRYSKTRTEAQDVLQEGFIKVFKDLHQYKPIKPLRAWIRRVMVNTALENIRKNKKNNEYNSHLTSSQLEFFQQKNLSSNYSNTIEDAYNVDYIVSLIQQLPIDYQIVFNLFAVEGYSHKEIAKKLEISEGASKVRLTRARAVLQSKLKETIKE